MVLDYLKNMLQATPAILTNEVISRLFCFYNQTHGYLVLQVNGNETACISLLKCENELW